MGTFHRRIQVSGHRAGEGWEYRGALEDDMHHFLVWMRHNGSTVTDIGHYPRRSPMSYCPAAGDQLQLLRGITLQASSVASHSAVNARTQCTHMLDLAGLMIATAYRGDRECDYLMRVDDPQEDGQSAVIEREGRDMLRWQLELGIITSPSNFAGVTLGRGFTQRATEHLELRESEPALLLRRAVFVSGGRQIDLDSPDFSPSGRGGCYALQPERIESVERIIGSSRDFSTCPEKLLSEDIAWLSFQRPIAQP